MDARIKTIILDEPHLPRFDKIDPTAELECDFETVALRVLARLYSSCHVFVFRPLVAHNGVGWRPDLAIVDKDWAFWFVVEIEIITHSLEKHVLPQVRAFRDGDYGPDACAAIAASTAISCDNAATLVRYVPRYVAVVSNQESANWVSALTNENVQYLSISGYQRAVGPPAYLVAGLLYQGEKSVGFGTVFPSHQCIRLQRTSFWQTGSYRIIEGNGVAEWDCFVESNVVWLTKRQGVITLPERTWVQLIAQDDGVLFLRQI